MRVIAVIPARGGSKGIELKNLREVAGKPLLVHAIEQARAVSDIERVYVSSEDVRILTIAEHHGAIPVERPAELAGDFSPSEDALRNVLEFIHPKQFAVLAMPDIVVMLQATSPIRRPSHIKRAVEMVRDEGYDSALSVVPQHQFIWQDNGGGAYPLNYNPIGYRPMRQSVRHWVENGAIYAFRPWVLEQYNSRLGGKIGLVEMPPWCRFEVDTLDDLDIVEWIMGREDLY
jgi:N-acylneuraminate cytidylyltransferase